jgi:hypothetical protein
MKLRLGPSIGVLRRFALVLLMPVVLKPAAGQPTSFAGNAQHTAVFDVPAQPLNSIHWSTSINLSNTGAFAHYGAPLVTASNTVLVPVKTAGGFQVSAFEGATGRAKYILATDFIMEPIATNGWIPVYQPVIASLPAGQRLYFAGAGGTMYHVDNLDSDTPGAPVQECFYTNMDGYSSNSAAFNANVFINTPLTSDANGTIFFGFRVQTNVPAPFTTTDGGGIGRVDALGNGAYVLANVAAADNQVNRLPNNSAPALSNNGATLYAPVKGGYCYLLGLDAATLATKYKVRLLDPRNHSNAGILDDGTASPMVAPDDEVFMGVFGNPNNDSRGFLLHFSANLQTNKAPSAFGWDYTPAIVPSSMVPSYTGSSPYLLFSKYNNYAGGDGNGINRTALLDPNATQIDPHPSAPGLVEMREVLTVIGCTPDAEFLGTAFPYAVREWCINTAAVNPATHSIFTPSEDGRIYRWDLAADSLTEVATLGSGVGEPYVPTVVGPDGTIYTLNGGRLFALGGLTNVSVGVYSSRPDLCTVVAGDSITFTAVVTNPVSGPAPTGTVTFQDVTYRTLTRITNVLAMAVPVTNGVATVTTSALSAGTNMFGNHFIIASYSGDGTFQPGSATREQKVHAYASALSLSSALVTSNNAVTFTATASSQPPGDGTPTGMVAFWDHGAFLGQLPLNTNGVATLTLTNVTAGSHGVTASYASDTVFASSSASLVTTAPYLTGLTILDNGAFQFSFTNTVAAPFTVLSSVDLSLPLASWTILGNPVEVSPGQFQFTDSQGTNGVARFYCVRSP